MWGVFRRILCCRVCYGLFEGEKQAGDCSDNFCQDNPENDYFVVYINSLKDLAKYMIYGVKP